MLGPWYWVFQALQAAIGLGLRIGALVFLHQKKQKRFRTFFLAAWGCSALFAAAQLGILVFASGSLGATVENYVDAFFSFLFPHTALPPNYNTMLNFLKQLIVNSAVASAAINLVVRVSMFIAAAVYLKRSKRVAAFFDPNYVPLPETPYYFYANPHPQDPYPGAPWPPHTPYPPGP